MIDPNTLEDKVQEIVVDICKALYFHGIREVPIGAIMRLIGVDESRAAAHDGECFCLDEEFEALLEEDELAQYTESMEEYLQSTLDSIPPGTVMH
jgi:hypothetical protein